MNKLDREISSPLLSQHRRVRCLVLGNHRGQPPSIEDVDYVFNADDDFDVIVALGMHDLATLEQLIAHCSNPTAPLAAFSNAFGARVDAVVRESTIDAIALAISTLEPLVMRVSALPKIPPGIDRNGLLVLALAYTRNCAIEARWQPNSTELIDYPLLIGIENARTVLEELADAGLLRRRFFERLHVCQHCESSQLHAREVCVSCRSSHLAEHPLVHHYACGFQAAQTAFENQDGYVCPKCHKQLRHYGVDYDKPGIVITCQACGETMAEPQVGFICANCGSYTSAEHAGRRDWYDYDLLSDGVAALRARSLPHADIIGPGDRRSLRDFRLIVASHLSVAQRYDRPLTVCRITIDSLEREVGQPGALEVCQFIREILAQNIRQSDVIAALPTGAVACLSETNRRGAEVALNRLHKQITRVVRPPINLKIEVFEGDHIHALLQDLA